MSTGEIENWFGTMADVGPLYPFVGSEFVLFCVGVVLWVAWQISCTRAESAQYREEIEKHGDKKSLREVVEHD